VAGRPVAELTDRDLPAAELAALSGAPPDPPDVAGLEAWLRERLPRSGPEPAGQEAAAAVARVVADPGITRVDQLAAAAATGVRRLQRLFAEHVGVGPKWVIRRYRLHEVTERMAAGGPVDRAGLAADLGYADQAHFNHDWRRVTGMTPGDFAARFATPARRR
jgi:AraC-like DNA-binding protein